MIGKIYRFARRVAGKIWRSIAIRIAPKICPIAGYVKIENQVIANLLKHEMTYARFEREYADVISEDIDVTENEDWKPHTIWMCWWQGYDQAPPLVRQCIASVRHNLEGQGSPYHVVVLDKDNYKEYCSFNPVILDKWEKGIISNAHMADLLRIELLYRRGGIWMDATVFCTAKGMPDYLQSTSLFVYQRIELDRTDEISLRASNWLIASNKKSRIIALTRKLLLAYWERENTLLDYHIFHVFFCIALKKYPEEWKSMPVFNNISPHILQFELEEKYTPERFEQIKLMSDFHKLTHHIAPKKKGVYTFYDYILEYSYETCIV